MMIIMMMIMLMMTTVMMDDDDDDTRYEIMKMLNCLIYLDGRKASLYLFHT
jgi:hypothetical protein